MASQGNADHTLVALEKVATIPASPNDPIEAIRHVEFGTGFGGPFLVVTVAYVGGDNDHEFRACWDGAWLKSNPPGMAITLLHDAKGDLAKARISETLQISLAAAAGGMAEYALVGADGVEGGRAQIEL